MDSCLRRNDERGPRTTACHSCPRLRHSRAGCNRNPGGAKGPSKPELQEDPYVRTRAAMARRSASGPVGAGLRTRPSMAALPGQAFARPDRGVDGSADHGAAGVEHEHGESCCDGGLPMNMGGPPSRDESFWGRSGGTIFKMSLQKFSISSLSWDLNFD